MALTILSVVFLALLVLGVPVAFSIGLAAVSTILYEGLPVAVVFQRMAAGMNVFSFLAVPTSSSRATTRSDRAVRAPPEHDALRGDPQPA